MSTSQCPVEGLAASPDLPDLTSSLDDALRGAMDNLGEEITVGISLVDAISRVV